MQAQIWQLQFQASPSLLKDVRLDLATDEDILRYQVTRSKDLALRKDWRMHHFFETHFLSSKGDVLCDESRGNLGAEAAPPLAPPWIFQPPSHTGGQTT